jgi:type I restriction enzyme S subunit
MDLPSMAKGVKPGINRNDVYKRLIHLPTLEEQKHIVSILDAAYTEIEKVNDSVFKLKNNCDALKTAILKEELQSSEAA